MNNWTWKKVVVYETECHKNQFCEMCALHNVHNVLKPTINISCLFTKCLNINWRRAMSAPHKPQTFLWEMHFPECGSTFCAYCCFFFDPSKGYCCQFFSSTLLKDIAPKFFSSALQIDITPRFFFLWPRVAGVAQAALDEKFRLRRKF